MTEIHLTEDDWIGDILEGGPGCFSGPLKHFPLETLLATEPDYIIRRLDIAAIHLEGMESFESPIILLYNRGTDDEIVCFRKKNKSGWISYALYRYQRS